jgi:hypothetical protein
VPGLWWRERGGEPGHAIGRGAIAGLWEGPRVCGRVLGSVRASVPPALSPAVPWGSPGLHLGL